MLVMGPSLDFVTMAFHPRNDSWLRYISRFLPWLWPSLLFLTRLLLYIMETHTLPILLLYITSKTLPPRSQLLHTIVASSPEITAFFSPSRKPLVLLYLALTSTPVCTPRRSSPHLGAFDQSHAVAATSSSHSALTISATDGLVLSGPLLRGSE